MVTEISDEMLMQLITKGDKNAFGYLYDRYYEKLVWYAKGFINDCQIAEDIVQEVFIKIIEKPERFEKDKKFSTWVYTVTGNIAKNTIRNQQNQNRILSEKTKADDIYEPLAEAGLDRKKLGEALQNILKTLSDKERSLYILRYDEELSIKEISEILDMPEGSVKSGIFYLLKKFAGNLKAFNHGA